MTKNETNPPGRLADEWFGANLKAAREAAGLTQSEVAAQMRADGFPGFSQQVLAKAEAGPRGTGRQVSIGEAIALGRIVGTDAVTLTQPPALTEARALLWQVRTRLREQRGRAAYETGLVAPVESALEQLIGEAKAGDMAADLAEDIAAAERVLKGEKP